MYCVTCWSCPCLWFPLSWSPLYYFSLNEPICFPPCPCGPHWFLILPHLPPEYHLVSLYHLPPCNLFLVYQSLPLPSLSHLLRPLSNPHLTCWRCCAKFFFSLPVSVTKEQFYSIYNPPLVWQQQQISTHS